MSRTKEEIQQLFDEIKESAKGGGIELLQYIAARNQIAVSQVIIGDDVSDVLNQMLININIKAATIAVQQADALDDRIWAAFWQVFYAGLSAAIAKL